MNFTFDTPCIINEMPQRSDFAEFGKFEAKIAFRSANRAYLRTRAAEAQNWKCCYCGTDMQTSDTSRKKYVSLEHVIPKSEGGADETENLVAACQGCNNKRGSLPVDQFMSTRLTNTTKAAIEEVIAA